MMDRLQREAIARATLRGNPASTWRDLSAAYARAGGAVSQRTVQADLKAAKAAVSADAHDASPERIEAVLAEVLNTGSPADRVEAARLLIELRGKPDAAQLERLSARVDNAAHERYALADLAASLAQEVADLKRRADEAEGMMRPREAEMLDREDRDDE